MFEADGPSRRRRSTSKKFDVIIMNIANPDMVGHTGVMKAAVEAVHDTDVASIGSSTRSEKVDGVALITADHGNCELMFDPATRPAAHRAHDQSRAADPVRREEALRHAARRRRALERRADDPHHPRHRQAGGDDGGVAARMIEPA